MTKTTIEVVRAEDPLVLSELSDIDVVVTAKPATIARCVAESA